MNCLKIIVVIWLLAGVAVAEAQPATPVADPCEGLDAYLNLTHQAMQEYQVVDDQIRPILLGDRMRLRDPLTLSDQEWQELAEHAEATQTALRAIQPPPWLADYHQLQIELVGLESAFAREILKSGVIVAEPAFAKARSDLYSDVKEARQRAGESCADFAHLFELPTPTPAVMSTSTVVIPSLPPTTPTPSVGQTASTPGAVEATVIAYATEVASLQAQRANAQVTATALAVVAANSVLDPVQQNITIQTNLRGVLGGDEDALERTRQTLDTTLSRYPPGCRAGFVLISGNGPDIDQGIQVARRVEGLLREVRPDVFTEDTGFEHFAQPGVQPFGEVTISVFYYSGCEPIS